MQTSTIVESVQSDLSGLASLGGDVAARVAAQMTAAIGPSLRVRILEAVSEAANELAPQLPEGRVEVRIQGGDPVLVYVEDAPAPRARPGDELPEARITLRLPESLKARVDAAATREGLSVNGWLVRVIARSVETRARRVGSRLTGYARS
jgi:hypothetical protein